METEQIPSEISTPEKNVTVFVENVSKEFFHHGERIAAVDGVSFSLTEQQFVAITGPSGSGKTTLLYLLGALDYATSGTMMVDGVDVIGITQWQQTTFRREHVGFVFQSFNLVPNLTAYENVLLPMELAGGWKRQEMDTRAHDLLLQVGLPAERHSHRPGRLSAGQQQRVAIARALANDPQVILADEPTGNLDSQNGKRIIALLQQLAEQGRTVVVVTHDHSIAHRADLWLEINDGQIETVHGQRRPIAQAPQQKLKTRRGKKRKN
jgi:ABC-type lipoprotein export system ATPase subunit